jgi:hypothetical protein
LAALLARAVDFVPVTLAVVPTINWTPPRTLI